LASFDEEDDLGPDLEVSNHPTYANKFYTIALLGIRTRIIFGCGNTSEVGQNL